MADVLVICIALFKESRGPAYGMVIGGINMSMVAMFAFM